MRKRVFSAAALLLCLLLCACSGAVKKENTVFSVDDLPGKKIAVRIKTTADDYASAYENDGSNTKILRFEEWDMAVNALLQGRADCVVLDQKVAEAFTRRYGGLRILEDIFQDEKYGICIAKDRPELLEAFNEALKDLKKEKTLESITRHYLAEERPEEPWYVTPPDTAYPNGKLILATISDFEPYEYYAEGKLIGIDIDLARAIADRLGYELEITEMIFSKLVDSVTEHRADFGMAGLTVTEERMERVSFTEPYATERQVILVRDTK